MSQLNLSNIPADPMRVWSEFKGPIQVGNKQGFVLTSYYMFMMSRSVFLTHYHVYNCTYSDIFVYH